MWHFIGVVLLVSIHTILQFIGFIAIAFGLSVTAWPFLGLRDLRSILTLSICSIILFTPLTIAPQHVKLRALACIIAVELFFKTTDYAIQLRANSIKDHRFFSYANFLIPFPVLLVRYRQQPLKSKIDHSKWTEIGFALGTFVFCFILVELVSHIAMIRSSFILDHTLKFFIFILATNSLSHLLSSLEHLSGYNTAPLIDSAYRSRSVGECWYRYNTRVHSWFFHNIFCPLGGRHKPVLAVFITFLSSAIIHEIGFAIAVSRIDGYQFIFFLIQAPAVLLWHQFRRSAKGSAFKAFLTQSSTIIWMWATSIFFFHGVNKIFPFFYVSKPWLP